MTRKGDGKKREKNSARDGEFPLDTPFDLAMTLESGQFFRYKRKKDDEFELITGDRVFSIVQRGNALHYNAIDEISLRKFLRLDGSDRESIARLKRDPVLAPIIKRYEGMRVLRQEPHETVLAFICSANSNIPKIRQNLELIAHNTGTRRGDAHHLPAPGTALDMAAIKAAKTGYRAPFIVEANRKLTPSFMRRLRNADYAAAHAMLQDLPGIGPKVADCVCLYGLDHGAAFPVDVHILRAMRTLFPKKRFKNEKEAKSFAQQRWGGDAGLAQQCIFQWARENLRAPKKARMKIEEAHTKIEKAKRTRTH